MNEPQIIEETNTGLGAEHKDEEEIDEEHQHTGTRKAGHGQSRWNGCSSVDSHGHSNKEDEKKCR